MNKKRTFAFGAATVLSVGLLSTVLIREAVHSSTPISASNPHVLMVSTYAGIKVKSVTSNGNDITFVSSGLTESTGVGTLSSGGYIYNVTKLSGIEKIEVTLSSGSVDIYYGKTSNTSWGDYVSSDVYDVSAILPNYFKIVATSDAVISSIALTYACYDYQEEATQNDYKLFVNDIEADVTFLDASKPGEGYDKQYQAILDVYPGDVLSFRKGSSVIYPTASYDGNNAYADGSRGYLAVSDEAKGAHLYLKVTGSNYDVWLTGKGSSWSHSALADGAILQAWNWSIASIKNNLTAIAEAGYKSIQISPMQIHTGVSSSAAWKSVWADLYRPYSYTIAESAGDSVIGTKAELTELCALAKAKGLGIIMDVVINHFDGNGNATSFHPSVHTHEPTIYDAHLWHTYGEKNDSAEGTVLGALGDYPDLNTGDARVMTRALSLFKDYLDCGVTGFRIDAAKHIETPFDNASYASSFYPYVINGSKRYAAKKGYDVPYYYGEALGAGNDRSLNWYAPYMSVTEASNSYDLRSGVNNGNISLINGNYYSGLNPDHYVLWAESHDLYQNTGDSNCTKGMIETNVNKVYAIQASRAQAVPMYMARPNDDSTRMGSSGNSWWKDPVVKAVNLFHATYAPWNEYVDINASCFVNVRGSGSEAGAVVANVANGASSFAVHLPNMGNGEYRDLISGNHYNVNDGYATLSFTEGVCVLVPVSSSTCYLVGNSVFTGKAESWTKESGIALSASGTAIAEAKDIRLEEGAKVKVMRSYSDSTPDKWYNVSLVNERSYCFVDDDFNLEFRKGGTYTISLYADGKYGVDGTPDEEGEESSSIPPSSSSSSSSKAAEVNVTTTFKISKDPGYGYAVYLVGDFCSWGDGLDNGTAVRLSYSAGVNSGTLTREEGETIKYKFVIAAYDSPSKSSATWEGGGDRAYTFSSSQTTVNCTWQ